MKVKELIEKLQTLEQEIDVLVPQCDLQEGKFYNIVDVVDGDTPAVDTPEGESKNYIIVWGV